MHLANYRIFFLYFVHSKIDNVVLPISILYKNQNFYFEKIIYLPNSYQVNNDEQKFNLIYYWVSIFLSKALIQIRNQFEKLLQVDENLIVFGDESLRDFVFERRNPSNTQFVVRDLSWFKLNEFYSIPFFHKYLNTLKKTGIVNMWGATPYLYIGKRRLMSELDSNDTEITPEIQNLIDLADEAQARMVQGAIKKLKKENKVADVTNINRVVRKDALTILGMFISHH